MTPDRVTSQDGQMRDLLKAWGLLEVVGVLGGGNRNTVMEARLGARRVVVRRSRRPSASLDWEADLLDHLARNGLRVPAVIPALDGRRHIDGVMVQGWLDGTAPAVTAWPAVAAFLRRLHRVTTTWPQRPGSASTRDLLTTDRGATWTCPRRRRMRLPPGLGSPGRQPACRRARRSRACQHPHQR
jgi:Ser/Thr protein kinase RdoA (MazF antagonist)